jgi:Ca2+-transporting ATPase
MAGIAYRAWSAVWRAGNPAWQTMLFTTLGLLQMGHVLAIRIERASVIGRRFWDNRILLGAVGTVVGLQLVVIYAPPLQGVFGTVPLSGAELALCLVLSTTLLWAVEVETWIRRANQSTTP